MDKTRMGAENDVLIAQVESYVERKDYQRKGRCVRLTAIESKDVENLERGEGVTAITVDLSYWQFCRSILGNTWPTRSMQRRVNSGQIAMAGAEKSSWFSLRVRWNDKSAHGYAYRTFSEDEPQYFSLTSCTPISALNLDVKGDLNLLTHSSSPKALRFGTGQSWVLWTFHVGQGMCSLLTDGMRHGILLDAGAGTPVVRPKYIRKHCPMRNDLMKLVASLDCVDLVLSHTDGDHWRLLAWDESLREKINNIYIPEKAKSLALKDKAVCKKVKEVNSFGYELSGGGSLEVLRSIPATKDDNTECLVSLYKSSDMRHLALQSGDYVYKDMIRDGNPSIRSLDQHRYSAMALVQ